MQLHNQVLNFLAIQLGGNYNMLNDYILVFIR